MRVLFLCTEMAGYFANCIQLFRRTYDSKISVVAYPVNADAPFALEYQDVEFVLKHEYPSRDLLMKCLLFNPDLVYIAGWVDKEYLQIGRVLKRKGAIVVGGVDNVWTGNIRQRLASLFSKLLVRPYFTHLWVAGLRQYQYALHLGFPPDKILTGLYTADIDRFQHMPIYPTQRILFYVGRFEEIKGTRLLYNVFSNLNESERNGWKLSMVGNGPLKRELKTTSNIEFYDFMQPDELMSFAIQAGGFILPSLHEPWGVVVHEFAAAGKPLLLSSGVNSGEEFLIHNFNGYRFTEGNAESLKNILIRFFQLEEKELNEMGQRSHQLALKYTPQQWVRKLGSLIK